MPATIDHLREALAHWRPDQVVLNLHAFDSDARARCRAFLAAAGASAAWYGGDPRELLDRSADTPIVR